MKKPSKTSPTSNVISNSSLEKKRKQKELTRPRECLSMAFSDDSPPLGEPEPKSSVPTSDETNAAKDAALSQTANQHDVGRALDWWKIALSPDKEAIRKIDPDLMRRAERVAKALQKFAEKQQTATTTPTEKPMPGESWARFHKRKAQERGEEE